MSDPDIYRRLAALEKWRDDMASVERSILSSGTFTPTFLGTGTAGTFTYSSQVGIYRRENDKVTIYVEVGISAIAVAPTTNMRIAGLPIAAAAGANYSLAIGTISNLDYPAGMLELTAFVEGGQSYIVLAYARDNAATLAYPAASFTNASALLRLAGSYLV
jgi:hypothetical protein